MDDRETSESPIERVVGAAGPQVTEAFELLGNETRLAILLALWEAVEPSGDGEVPLSFSDLRDRVGMRDSGQFNYHLEQLINSFVRDTGDGYALKAPGYSIIEAVIAGAGIENPQLEPTEIDVPCPFCGSPTAIGYQNEFLYQVCTQCEGEYEKFGPLADAAPELGGLLYVAVFDPAGVPGRTPQEVYEAGVVKGMLRTAMQLSGVCSRCSGTIEASLGFCDEHETGENDICPNCGQRLGFGPQFTCTVCKYTSSPVPSVPAGFHPAVIDFYAEHGITIGDVTDPESIVRMDPLMRTHEATLISTDPPRVRVTIRHEGDELHLTYDEDVNIIEVAEEA